MDAPERVGRMLTSLGLERLFKEAPGGVHFWITTMFDEVIERIPPNQCFRFWKREVKQRLLEDGVFLREHWPGQYAYLAQEWRTPFPEPLVQLKRCE